MQQIQLSGWDPFEERFHEMHFIEDFEKRMSMPTIGYIAHFEYINHDIFNWAKISSITNVTVNDTEYVALNLELDAPIDTTTTMLVSTMPW